MLAQDGLRPIHSARLLAIGLYVAFEETRYELLQRCHFPLLRLPVSKQLNLPLLAPVLRTRLRADRGLHPLPEHLAIGHLEHDVHLPSALTAFVVLPDFHAHRRDLLDDSARLCGRQPTSSTRPRWQFFRDRGSEGLQR